MCMYKSPAVSCVCRVLDEVLQKLVHLVQEEECVSVSQAHTHSHITLCFLYAHYALFAFKHTRRVQKLSDGLLCVLQH